MLACSEKNTDSSKNKVSLKCMILQNKLHKAAHEQLYEKKQLSRQLCLMTNKLKGKL